VGLLLGTPLTETLRWSGSGDALSWQRASRPAADRCD